MKRRLFAVFLVAGAAVWLTPAPGFAQETEPPTLRVGLLPESVAINGALSEPAWELAESIDAFVQTDPAEGTPPSARTEDAEEFAVFRPV